LRAGWARGAGVAALEAAIGLEFAIALTRRPDPWWPAPLAFASGGPAPQIRRDPDPDRVRSARAIDSEVT
jgi:hypothetical protein